MAAPDGPAAFVEAAGHAHCVRALFASGSGDPHRRNASGWTPLYAAAFNGYHACLGDMLRAQPFRAQLDEACTAAQATPLHAACLNGHRECVDVLIGAGAALNQGDRGGEVALTPSSSSAASSTPAPTSTSSTATAATPSSPPPAPAASTS